jgi:hypothetical protein
VICGDDDNEDNSWNYRGGYYKPFFTLAGGRLTINGVPVPKSQRSFFAAHPVLCGSYLVRFAARCYYAMFSPSPAKNSEPPTGALLLDMSKYVTSKGARFAVGLQHSNRDLEAFLQKFKIPYVELETTNPALVHKDLGNHWTPAGHAFVAGKIGAFLETK